MSKKTSKWATPRSKTQFQVKPVPACAIAAIVLEELSHAYGQYCNYLEAANLAKGGDVYLAS